MRLRKAGGGGEVYLKTTRPRLILCALAAAAIACGCGSEGVSHDLDMERCELKTDECVSDRDCQARLGPEWICAAAVDRCNREAHVCGRAEGQCAPPVVECYQDGDCGPLGSGASCITHDTNCGREGRCTFRRVD